MARKPKIHNPGGIYHVMLRGNGGQNIFMENLERIIKTVCEGHKIIEKALAEHSRGRKLSECRGIICWLSRKLKVVSLSKIGVRFNRDVATLSRIVSKIEKRMRKDKSYQEKIMQYNNTITQA